MKSICRFNKNQKSRLEHEVKKQVLIENEKYERSLDVFFIYCLHDVFGFGNNRIKRLYEKMLSIRNEMKARYKADEEENSNDYLFAMEKQLKDCGIDVDEILEVVETK